LTSFSNQLMVFNFKTCTLSKEIHDDHVSLGLKFMGFNYVTVSILSDLKCPIQWKKTKTIVKRNTIQNRRFFLRELSLDFDVNDIINSSPKWIISSIPYQHSLCYIDVVLFVWVHGELKFLACCVLRMFLEWKDCRWKLIDTNTQKRIDWECAVCLKVLQSFAAL